MLHRLATQPMSRRAALATFGASLATFLPWPGGVFAQDAIPTFPFVVVSDTHLGRDDREEAAQQWTRTARETDAAAGDFVLHLGDVVDGAREPQYAVYKDVRKSIRKPVYEIPGNHDDPVAFARHVRQNVDMAFDHQGVRFLLFNNSRRGSINGFITADQLKWLTAQCAEAAEKKLFLILAMHVPAHDNKAPDLGAHVRPGDGQKELYSLLDRHRTRVLALLHGHFHCGLRGWEDRAPLHEIIFPSALFNSDRRNIVRQAAGYNLPEFRPGFVLASVGKEGLTLKYKPVGVDGTTERICPLMQVR